MIISIYCLLMTNALMAQKNDTDLAKTLISLRGQVEDLQSELKILKSEHKNSMSYLNTRKVELQANVDRKQLHIKQSQLEIEKLQEKIKLLGSDSEHLLPQVSELINAIKASITNGIPFKHTERLEVVNDISRRLQARKITAQNAINRLWAFLEDEIRLTKENAIYTQTIELNGEKVLVDVAKLGMVMMYFKTRDDKYGVSEKQGNQWQYKLAIKGKDIQLIATLFDSLNKQIRQGYFHLPLAINTGDSQ